MHKLLAGLISTHELLGSARALAVAVGLATHLRTRVDRLLARGLSVWHDFINQEVGGAAEALARCMRACVHTSPRHSSQVGGTSEALADLARVTGNSSWLQLAAMFERPCFVGPLALGDGAAAIEKVHANTHLPQLLGVMARFELTGEQALRTAAEAFWTEIARHHTFATGSSTTGEVWLRAGSLGDAVVHQKPENYWAHDQAETCVAHNSMRVSRRLLQVHEELETSAPPSPRFPRRPSPSLTFSRAGCCSGRAGPRRCAAARSARSRTRSTTSARSTMRCSARSAAPTRGRCSTCSRSARASRRRASLRRRR